VSVKSARGRRFARPLARAAHRYLGQLDLRGCELSISVVGDSAIRRLNRRWRQHDSPTDVLSFPVAPEGSAVVGRRLLGDVVISMDTTLRRARRFGVRTEDELERYLAHGLLHLLGYDHQTRPQAAKMAALEAKLLGGRGLI
jgi:probable rRNA maturation factor